MGIQLRAGGVNLPFLGGLTRARPARGWFRKTPARPVLVTNGGGHVGLGELPEPFDPLGPFIINVLLAEVLDQLELAPVVKPLTWFGGSCSGGDGGGGGGEALCLAARSAIVHLGTAMVHLGTASRAWHALPSRVRRC